jgi:hypothetical protein
MTAASDENVTAAAAPRRRVFAGRVRLGMVLAVLCISIVGSAALVLVADHFIFRYGSWSGWKLTPTVAKRDDLQWWQAHVGALPTATTTEGWIAPARPSGGRDDWNRDGVPGPPGAHLPDGLVTYTVETSWPTVHGKVVSSSTTHAWWMGLDLPGGMVVQRICICRAGQPPPQPTLGGWSWRTQPLALVLNMLYAAGPVCVVVTLVAWAMAAAYRSILGKLRLARHACPKCGHGLLPGQDTCPECGHRLSIPRQ